MTPLNDGREGMVNYIDRGSFLIDEDTTKYPEEVRKPFHYDFRPFEVSIKNPEELKPFINTDSQNKRGLPIWI